MAGPHHSHMQAAIEQIILMMQTSVVQHETHVLVEFIVFMGGVDKISEEKCHTCTGICMLQKVHVALDIGQWLLLVRPRHCAHHS